MDAVIEFIHSLMPALFVLAILALLVKIILIFSTKGFDILALLLSFFRLYTKSDLDMTSKKKRINYMRYNNYINYYFYVFLFLFTLMLIIFKRNIFS